MGIETYGNNDNFRNKVEDVQYQMEYVGPEGKDIKFDNVYNTKQQEEQQRKQQESQQESTEQNNEKVNASIQKFFTDSLKELGAEKFIKKFHDDNIQLLDILKSLPQDNPFFQAVADFFSKRKNYTPYINGFKQEKLKALKTAKLQQQEIEKKQRERQEIKKIQKDIPAFINEIQQGTIKIQFHGDSIPFTWSHFLYAIKNNQAIDLHIEDQNDKAEINNIITFIKKHLKTSYKLFKNYIPKDTEAINYLNELPKNKTDWTNALQIGSSELSQIFQNKDNQEKLTKLTGLSQDEINDTRNFRAFLLTHQDIFDKIIKTFNYDDETKKITKGEKTKEKVLDTSNYTFRMMERYGIDKGKREQKKFDDGGTGLFAITNYYLKNKNNPQAQAFCKEYEEKILPGLIEKFNQTKFQDSKITTFDELIKLIREDQINSQTDKALSSQLFGTVGNALNEQNKTEELKKQSMTRESAETGDKLKNTFGAFLDHAQSREILRGKYFQESLQQKLNDLGQNNKLQPFFQAHPELSSLLKVENLANLNVSSLAESGRKLLNLIGKIFFSEKASASYATIADKLDNAQAVSETVDQVFEEALNDENLFKDFENESINLEDEKYQGVIDITGDKTINYGELLDEFDKKHKHLSKSIEEYTENHDPTSDREALWEDHAKESLITKLNKLSKKYQEKLHIDLGLNTILKREDINLNEKNTTTLPFDRSEVERRLHKKRLKMSDHLKQKIENKIKKLIEKEQEKKKNYIENSDSSLNKLIITNRVQTTINMLQSYPFTKGLNLNVDDPQSILIDKDLNITLQGNYEGKPCQLCINANGEVKTTVYYEYSHTDEQITFNNSPNFTLFTLPSLKEQREIGLQTLKEENAREEVSQQFKEQIKVNPKGIEDFPREKEKGLCLLKIKELTRGTKIMTNKATPQKYQFFKEMEESIKNAEDANRIKRILSRFEKAIHQMHNGATFIEENSQIFHTLFNKTTLEKQKNNANNANNETKFDENSYVILLRHFMREEGGTKTLRIDDMVAFIKAFSEGGDTAIQKQEAKILGQATGEQDSQYRAYQNTKLAKLLKKTLEQKESKGPKG